MVPGHEQVGHTHALYQGHDGRLERLAERGEVAGVEHGMGTELPRQLTGDLEADRVEMDVADVEDPRLVGRPPLLQPEVGGVKIGDVTTEDVEPVADVLQALHVGQHRVYDAGRLLQGPLEDR